MKLSEEEKRELKGLCRTFRKDLIETLYKRQTGHPGGSLSVCEILTVLYFKVMHTDPQDPNCITRDRLVLSKGHAAPMLYRVLAEKGFFPVEELETFRCLGSRLQGHPCSHNTPGVDISSGPLGLGLSAALGMALAFEADGNPARVYAVLGDGELNEGTIWEACMCAAKYKADKLCAIVDRNHVQLDGTSDELLPLGNLKAKFESFGWNCIECDGHDVDSIYSAICLAQECKGKPSVIIAETVKGKGVSVMEGKNIWHGRPIDKDTYLLAAAELESLEVC